MVERLLVPRSEGRLWQVAGVARDSKYLAVFETPLPHMYFAMRQSPSFMRVLYIRSAIAPEVLGPLVEREIQALDPDVPVADVKTMTQVIEGGMGFVLFRVGTLQAGAMGVLGLLLTIVGVYGVVSYGASQRTREIGIRMALGAEPAAVRRLILREAPFLSPPGLRWDLASRRWLRGLSPAFSTWVDQPTSRRSSSSRPSSRPSLWSLVICRHGARCGSRR